MKEQIFERNELDKRKLTQEELDIIYNDGKPLINLKKLKNGK